MAQAEAILLDPQPHKRFFLNEARSYSPDLALYEFVDNAVDNWRRNDQPGALEIRIRFHFAENRCTSIVISDNGGGVPRERLQALVQVGAETTDDGGIGVWGSGLKIGAIALCSHWTIETSFAGEVPRRIDWPASWWDEETWEPLKAEPLPEDSIEPGTFHITLQDMQEPLTRHEIFGQGDVRDPFVRRLGRVYAPLLSEEGDHVRILLQDGDKAPVRVQPDRFGDPARFDEFFAAPPGFEPRRYQLPLDRSKGLELELVVGLLPEQSRDLSGVSMYGKGRLFEQALKEGTVGFGTRGRAKIPASHPTTWRLAVLAYFDGPPDLIPWGSPAKRGYKEANPYHKQIRTAIMDAALPYATFTKVAKRLDVLPFSAEWMSKPEETRRTEVQRFTRDKATAERLIGANPHLLKPRKPALPPIERADSVTALQEKAEAHLKVARQAAAFLRKRDTKKPDGIWSSRQAPQEGEPAPGPDFIDPWKKHRTLSLPLPEPTAALIENEANLPLREWILQVIDAAAAEFDPVWRIPQHPYRAILLELRQAVLASHPDVDAIAVFGSVVRGEADRESDIDLLIVHEDRLGTQVDLEKRFKDFRYPPGKDRYSVQLLVSKPGRLQAHASSSSREFQTMLEEAVWIHGSPPNATGETNDGEQRAT